MNWRFWRWWKWIWTPYTALWIAAEGRSRWQLRLPGAVWLGAFLGMGLFWWLVIAFSPLRYTIPGYPTRIFFKRYQELLMQVSVLEERVTQQGHFIENLRQLAPEEALSLPAPQLLPTFQARGYAIPLEGQVSRGFAPDKDHWGIDITANGDEPILAMAEGTIVIAEYSYQTGYLIAIQHPNGLLSLYKHNSRLLRRVGEKVLPGDVIALAGGLGTQSSGPHLHLETWIGGEPMDPLRLTTQP